MFLCVDSYFPDDYNFGTGPGVSCRCSISRYKNVIVHRSRTDRRLHNVQFRSQLICIRRHRFIHNTIITVALNRIKLSLPFNWSAMWRPKNRSARLQTPVKSSHTYLYIIQNTFQIVQLPFDLLLLHKFTICLAHLQLHVDATIALHGEEFLQFCIVIKFSLHFTHFLVRRGAEKIIEIRIN